MLTIWAIAAAKLSSSPHLMLDRITATRSTVFFENFCVNAISLTVEKDKDHVSTTCVAPGMESLSSGIGIRRGLRG